MCYSAKAVANFFIKKSLEDHKPLTHLQLQKMVFFAHAVYFKEYHKPLVVDPVFAWKYGPVFLDLYLSLKDYGDSPVTDNISDAMLLQNGEDVFVTTPEINSKDTKVLKFLDGAYNALHDMTGGRLCAISHAKGGAWYKTLEERGLDPEDKNVIIPRNLVILDDAIEACGK